MPTVNEIYQQVLGRPAEPEGLAYWKSVFGDYVDDTELAQFKTAAAPELAQRALLTGAGNTTVTNQQIIDFLLTNPGMSDADIVKAMETYGVSPAQMASAVGLSEGEVVSRVAATIPEGMSVTLGDTRIAPQYEVRGSGEDRQVVGIENIYVEKTTGDVNYKAPVGSDVQVLSPTGEFVNTIKTQKVESGFGEFLAGAGLLFGGAALAGLGGGAGAATVGTTGLTLGELAQLDLALGGAGGTAGATSLATALTTGAAVPTLTNLTGGSGTGTIGSTGLTLSELSQLDLSLGGTGGTTGALTLGEQLSGLAAGTLTGAATGTGLLSETGTVAGMGTGTGITTAGAGGLGGGTTVAGLGTGVGTGLTTTGAGLGVTGTGAGITAGTGLTGTGVLAGSGLGTTLLGTGTGALTGTGVLTGSGLGTTLLGTGAGTGVTGALTTGVGTGLATGLGTGALTTGVGTGLGTALGTAAGTGLGGLTAAQLGALISGGLNTGAGLLQQQTSREAAIAAKTMIDKETAAAKLAAQFKPIGMTTRFGASQFGFDPVTGQLTSAGYTLSPEAKNAQDRFVKLAESGLQQAEGAQLAFKPLQTGAESLFKLGQGYLAKSPEDVAQNYLNQQMALLKPGRELELATLQNRLQQQGRGGLSVAQGGTLGATTPELQALYNARATQEAQLAANAQRAGQQDVLFGAGLLGQGSQAMGQYYGGQQASYAPYTTALQQVTGLESAAQQPLTMSTALAQQVAQAGSNVGQLGLRGAEQSVALATGRAATTNPYATLLSGLGAAPALGTAAGNALYSLFG